MLNKLRAPPLLLVVILISRSEVNWFYLLVWILIAKLKLGLGPMIHSGAKLKKIDGNFVTLFLNWANFPLLLSTTILGNETSNQSFKIKKQMVCFSTIKLPLSAYTIFSNHCLQDLLDLICKEETLRITLAAVLAWYLKDLVSISLSSQQRSLKIYIHNFLALSWAEIRWRSKWKICFWCPWARQVLWCLYH